jgi:hypothetical protein
MKFRKKPVVIDAMLWDGTPEASVAIGVWVASLVPVLDQRPIFMVNEDWTMKIPTLEGDHLAMPGDWIICGVQKEFYPCKPGIFAATYERAE